MDQQNHFLLFQPLSQIQLTKIQNQHIQASCCFQIVSIDSQNFIFNPEKSRQAILQIRSNYLIEVSQYLQKIISGVRLDYSVQFETSKKGLIFQNQSNKNKGMQAFALRIWQKRIPHQDYFNQKRQENLNSKQYSIQAEIEANLINFKQVMNQKHIIIAIQDLKLFFKPGRVLKSKEKFRVFQAMNLKDKKKYIIKAYPKQKIINQGKFQHLLDSFNLLQKIEHPYIIKLQKIFQTKNTIYTVEKLYSTNLQNLSKLQNGRLMNSQRLIHRILQTVNFLHENKIAHNNLCQQNILINYNSHQQVTDIVITGFSEISIFNNEYLKLKNKSQYEFEEQLEQEFESMLNRDLKKCGQILHFMLTSKKIYQTDLFMENIIKPHYDYQLVDQLKKNPSIPSQAIDLFKKLFGICQGYRMSCKQILQSDYIKDYSQNSEINLKGQNQQVKTDTIYPKQ